jgi:hypothetical protein
MELELMRKRLTELEMKNTRITHDVSFYATYLLFPLC